MALLHQSSSKSHRAPIQRQRRTQVQIQIKQQVAQRPTPSLVATSRRSSTTRSQMRPLATLSLSNAKRPIKRLQILECRRMCHLTRLVGAIRRLLEGDRGLRLERQWREALRRRMTSIGMMSLLRMTMLSSLEKTRDTNSQ